MINNSRQGGLPNTRRSPQNKRGYPRSLSANDVFCMNLVIRGAGWVWGKDTECSVSKYRQMREVNIKHYSYHLLFV